jgi:hypothetical protein
MVSGTCHRQNMPIGQSRSAIRPTWEERDRGPRDRLPQVSSRAVAVALIDENPSRASRRWTRITWLPRSLAAVWPTTGTYLHATEARRRGSVGWPATSRTVPARWPRRTHRCSESSAASFRPARRRARADASGRERIWEHCWERDSTNDTRILGSGRSSQPAVPPATWTVDTDWHPSDRSMPPHNPAIVSVPNTFPMLVARACADQRLCRSKHLVVRLDRRPPEAVIRRP